MIEMKQKSLKKNAVLILFRTTLSLIVPLITFPYVSRVLGVEALGKFNFSSSIVNYFLLIAGLGIGTYSIREGSKVRDDKEQISKLASEIFCLNVISTLFSYLSLVVCVLLITKLHAYTTIIGILSAQILLNLYGKSWIYSIFEDFEYTTIVQVLFQCASVIALFVLVQKPRDLIYYAIISVASSSGANIFYGIHAKKFISLNRVKISTLTKHIKPIMIIFSTSIATTIYVNSDMTILGWMIDDRCVGLYSTAVKIYNIIKQVMIAVITVSVPRLTLYAGTEKFKPLFFKVFHIIFFMAMPAMTGLMFMSKNVIIIIAGEEYSEVTTALQWLSIALVFALLASLIGLSVLLPYNKEKIFLFSTIVSAVVNIVMNFILIPIYQQNAAAFTTALSQAVSLGICYHYSKEHISLKDSLKPVISVLVGCIGIVCTCTIIKHFSFEMYTETLMAILGSVMIYCIIQIVIHNVIFMDFLRSSVRLMNGKIRKSR